MSGEQELIGRYERRYLQCVTASYASCLPYLYYFHGQSLTRACLVLAGFAAVSKAVTLTRAYRNYIRKASEYVLGNTVDEDSSFSLRATFNAAKSRLGMRGPHKLHIIDKRPVNAFASPDDVYITEPLRRMFNHNELQFVIGHELSHIKNDDIVKGMSAYHISLLSGFYMLMTLSHFIGYNAALEGAGPEDVQAIMVEARNSMLLLPQIIGCTALSDLFNRAASRQREYRCDIEGAIASASPENAISVLKDIHRVMEIDSRYDLTDYHPALHKRIAALEELSKINGPQ